MPGPEHEILLAILGIKCVLIKTLKAVTQKHQCRQDNSDYEINGLSGKISRNYSCLLVGTLHVRYSAH